jgi:sigma-B regulation protein RsbQ
LPGLDGTGDLFEPLLARLDASIEPIVVRYPLDETLGYDAALAAVRVAARGRASAVARSLVWPKDVGTFLARSSGLRTISLQSSAFRTISSFFRTVSQESSGDLTIRREAPTR